jgi:NADPH-dependent curcumin reductase CurA
MCHPLRPAHTPPANIAEEAKAQGALEVIAQTSQRFKIDVAVVSAVNWAAHKIRSPGIRAIDEFVEPPPLD